MLNCNPGVFQESFRFSRGRKTLGLRPTLPCLTNFLNHWKPWEKNKGKSSIHAFLCVTFLSYPQLKILFNPCLLFLFNFSHFGKTNFPSLHSPLTQGEDSLILTRTKTQKVLPGSPRTILVASRNSLVPAHFSPTRDSRSSRGRKFTLTF